MVFNGVVLIVFDDSLRRAVRGHFGSLK